MKNRLERINEEMRKELAAIIGALKDPRIPTLCSVLKVNVTNDLKYAKVYVSVLAPADVQNEALKGLKNAEGFIRRGIGERMDLRYTPELIFNLDHSMEQGAHIDKLIQEINITASASGENQSKDDDL